jgi:hypothetical protein
VKTFEQLISDALQRVAEVYPWDLVEKLEHDADKILLVDIRETYEEQEALVVAFTILATRAGLLRHHPVNRRQSSNFHHFVVGVVQTFQQITLAVDH